MKLFIDIVMKRIYLFNISAWNYRKKIGFPVCKKENFAGLEAHRKRGKNARTSPTPHHTLNEALVSPPNIYPPWLFLSDVSVTRVVYFHVNVTCVAAKHLKFDSHYSN